MAVIETRNPFSWWKLARTALGLSLAPVLGGTVGVLLFSLPDVTSGHADLQEFAGLTLFGAYFGAFFGLVPALVVGWPLHLVLLRLRWTSIFVYIGLGAVLGMIALPLGAFVLEGF